MATSRMRKCMLLPITDSVEGAISFKVFQEVETYLKESDWCYYRSNAEILNILGGYRRDLYGHLQSPDVIRVIAQKIRAGSVIRINIISQLKGVELTMEVVGEDGKDQYFREKEILDNDDIGIISDRIKNWLDAYQKIIPYNGTILSYMGQQITIDMGRTAKVQIGQEFEVLRPVGKKRHPLLKEVVEWQTHKIGKGKIFSVSDFQALGVIKVMEIDKKLRKGDWIRLVDKAPGVSFKKYNYPEIKENQFGKLGYANVSLNIGSASASSVNGSTRKEIGGLALALSIKSELWITRDFFADLELKKGIGSFKKKTGTLAQETNSLSTTTIHAYGGYRFLPMGFFYGPQINLFAGLSKFSKGLDTVTADGFTSVSFTGIMLGFNANAPIVKGVRAFGELKILPKPGFEEDTVIVGDAESSSSYTIELGVNYKYSPFINIDGGIEIENHKAVSGTKEINHKSTMLKAGASFNF